MELFSGELSTHIFTQDITKRGLCVCIVVRRHKLSGGPHSCHQPEPLFSISQFGGNRPGRTKIFRSRQNTKKSIMNFQYCT